MEMTPQLYIPIPGLAWTDSERLPVELTGLFNNEELVGYRLLMCREFDVDASVNLKSLLVEMGHTFPSTNEKDPINTEAKLYKTALLTETTHYITPP